MAYKVVHQLILIFLLKTKVSTGLKGKIRRCTATSIESGYHKTYFFDTVCNPNNSTGANVTFTLCGDNPLTSGNAKTKKKKGVNTMKIKLQGANPFSLYSIYFLPLGANPCEDMVFIGEVLTNGSGRAKDKFVRNCGPNPSPSCLNAGDVMANVVDVFDLVGDTEAGNFFIYSRGASKIDTDGDGTLDQWDTENGESYNGLNNPLVWDSADRFDGIQYIVGV